MHITHAIQLTSYSDGVTLPLDGFGSAALDIPAVGSSPRCVYRCKNYSMDNGHTMPLISMHAANLRSMVSNVEQKPHDSDQ